MRPLTSVLLVISAALLPGGCASDEGRSGNGALEPADFVARSGGARHAGRTTTDPALERMDAAMEAARQGQIGVDVPVANPAAPPPPRPPAEPGPVPRAVPDDEPSSDGGDDGSILTAAAGAPLPLAGMVGQVNGRAIYAQEVFETIGEQLAALGRELPPSQFRRQATDLVRARMDEIVTDALILGEAERNLTDRERAILDWSAQQRREELLRRYGQGSLSLAEARIRETTGIGLDQTITNYRQRWMIEQHLRDHVLPRINVTRRDVERYYHDHPERYNPKPQRTLRLIRVADEAAAADVARRLEAGEAFAEVASSDVNRNRPDTGGLMETAGGETVFDNPALNDAMLALDQGEWAGPIAVGESQIFVYLEEVISGEQKSLRDVQLDIERQLREDQYRLLSAQERQRLMEEGSYNPLDEMVEQLVNIAVARYSTPTS